MDLMKPKSIPTCSEFTELVSFGSKITDIKLPVFAKIETGKLMATESASELCQFIQYRLIQRVKKDNFAFYDTPIRLEMGEKAEILSDFVEVLCMVKDVSRFFLRGLRILGQ